MTEKSKEDRFPISVDESKRRTLTRLALGAAFVTPVVASFSINDLTISKVHAQAIDGSGVVPPKKKKKPD
jgi:hypothetical protein